MAIGNIMTHQRVNAEFIPLTSENDLSDVNGKERKKKIRQKM